jgi:hypothetical protein
MRLFWATHAIPHDPTRVHPALTSFADECCGTLARLLAYVGVRVLLAIVGIHLLGRIVGGRGERAFRQSGLERGCALVSRVRRQSA